MRARACGEGPEEMLRPEALGTRTLRLARRARCHHRSFRPLRAPWARRPLRCLLARRRRWLSQVHLSISFPSSLRLGFGDDLPRLACASLACTISKRKAQIICDRLPSLTGTPASAWPRDRPRLYGHPTPGFDALLLHSHEIAQITSKEGGHGSAPGIPFATGVAGEEKSQRRRS